MSKSGRVLTSTSPVMGCGACKKSEKYLKSSLAEGDVLTLLEGGVLFWTMVNSLSVGSKMLPISEDSGLNLLVSTC